VSLVVVCVPAAKEMTVYDDLQVQIEQAVGRVNGQFAEVGWSPIRFFFRALPFEEVVAWYAESSVMWITPLRDGLNLVCKEYVVTQGQICGQGVLVLSEFAGAAAELHGALLTNPHDPADLRERLHQAIAMDVVERDSRLRLLNGIVCHNDIEAWGREFLNAVGATGSSQCTGSATEVV
jgi:glucosylglycerol-phosphate synthase